ncbi:unnamed protein product [Rhizophagus irregularis]|nr:unnamed protein product [Rhizophagus irregularis]
MLDTYNPYIQNFRQVRDLLQNDADSADISMRIYCDRSNDARRYNGPAASDVAAIMVGDGYEVKPSNRDIILNFRDGTLQRISDCILSMILFNTFNQSSLRLDLYKGVADAIHADDRDADDRDAGHVGQNIGR